jgi:hypothetical protein
LGAFSSSSSSFLISSLSRSRDLGFGAFSYSFFFLPSQEVMILNLELFLLPPFFSLKKGHNLGFGAYSSSYFLLPSVFSPARVLGFRALTPDNNWLLGLKAYLCSSTNQPPLLCNFFLSKLQQALLLQTLSILFKIRFVFSSAAARLKTFFCKSLQRVFARPKTHTKSTHQFQHPIVMQK